MPRQGIQTLGMIGGRPTAIPQMNAALFPLTYIIAPDGRPCDLCGGKHENLVQIFGDVFMCRVCGEFALLRISYNGNGVNYV